MPIDINLIRPDKGKVYSYNYRIYLFVIMDRE